MASLDQDRLMRAYAPRLADRADRLAGPHAPGGTVKDADTIGGLPNVQVVDDTADETEGTETEHTGVMVALYLPADIAEKLSLDPSQGELGDVDIEEPDELHLTLAYLGTAGIDVAPDRRDLFARTVQAWASEATPISGTISGIGVFNNEDTAATYASFDAPTLPEQRQRLVQMLESAGLPVARDHGFTPHITLAYGDARGIQIPRLAVTFDEVTIAYAGDQMTMRLCTSDPDQNDTNTLTPDEAKSVPLGEDIPPEDKGNAGEGDGNPKVEKTKPAKPQLVASDRTGPPQMSKSMTDHNDGYATWNPIVTTHGAKTVITGPATTERAAMWGRVPNPNRHMLWMQGRFVGAETPNRNGAFWSTSDLEVGKPTVAGGPLNWLHEERHIIGAIADAQLVPARARTLVDGAETAAETIDPHIAALSAIWSWVYPQEASVVQMASDAGVLAYSMECIAEGIQCMGDGGCGQTFPYMEVAAAGGGCDHLRQRGSVRRLVNPTFLGGAVIVPPTRPGWADADANVLKDAAAMAERAHEQAGAPDIPADTWERMMASVLTYTRSAT